MDDTRKPLSVGHKIAGYSIVREIGAGGFGIVYEAFNHALEVRAAIKQFYPQAIASWRQGTIYVSKDDDRELVEKVLEKFEKEAKLQFQLNHPNILKVKDFIRENNTGYLITDYVDGTTLVKFLERYGGVCPDEAMFRRTMEPIADALHYLHERLTLHRDISPENIMIDSTGKPILVDFGAAKRDLRLSNSVSTLIQFREDYAPIEQQVPSDERPEGCYTDIFAMAGTMYRALSGKPPERAVLRSLAAKDPYVPMARATKVDCSRSLLDAIDSGLKLAIADRPQTIEQFLKLMDARGPTGPGPDRKEQDETGKGFTYEAGKGKVGDGGDGGPVSGGNGGLGGAGGGGLGIAGIHVDPPRRQSRLPGYLMVLALFIAVIAVLFALSSTPTSPPTPTPSPTISYVRPTPSFTQTYTPSPVPSQTRASPTPSYTYTPPPPPRYTTYQNYDMEGGDVEYPKPPQLYGEQSTCETACNDNSSCVAYSYDKWIKACYLKTSLTELRSDPESVVVVRSNYSRPPDQAGSLDIEAVRFRFNDVNTPYSRTNPGSRKSCSDSCRYGNSCLGYQYEAGACSLYSRIDTATKDSNAQSGVKRQIAPDRPRSR